MRRLRPVRLKLELQPVSSAPSSSGRPSSSGSHSDSAASYQSPSTPATASPQNRRTMTGLHLRRKLTLASRHPFSALKSFGRRMDKRIEMSQDMVIYEVRREFDGVACQ